MTPDEIQQARDLARALLALTEQQPESSCPCDTCTWLHGPSPAEQHPEPPKRYRIDGPYSNGFELVDTADTVLGTYASHHMAMVDRDTLERRHREQSERDTDV